MDKRDTCEQDVRVDLGALAEITSERGFDAALDWCREEAPGVLSEFGDLLRRLRDDVEEAPACLPARLQIELRNAGWTAAAIDAALRFPAQGVTLRHPVRSFIEGHRRHPSHRERVTAARLFASGRHLLTASADATLKVWDVRTGACLRTLRGHVLPVTDCDLTPDGLRAVSGSWDETLRVWDLQGEREVRVIAGHQRGVTACALSPGGELVASASWDGTVRVWNVATGACLHTLREHLAEVTHCVIDARGQHLVSASEDGTVRVWHLTTGRPRCVLRGHASAVLRVAISPCGDRVASGGADRTVRLWRLPDGAALGILTGHRRSIRALAFAPDSRRLYSSAADGEIRVWDATDGSCLREERAESAEVTSLVVADDGAHVISTGADGAIAVRDTATWQRLHGLEGPQRRVTALCPTGDGDGAIAASSDGSIRRWDLRDGTCTTLVEGGGAAICCAGVDQKGRVLAAGLLDHSLVLHELSDGVSRVVPDAGDERLTHCVVAPDGTHVVTASAAGDLAVWRLRDGVRLAEWRGHTGPITSLCARGEHWISTSWDGTLRRWAVHGNGRADVIEASDHRIGACAVTASGVRAVTAAWDGRLTMWDLEHATPIADFSGHARAVSYCAYLPGERALVSASRDRTLRIWELGELDAAVRGCARATTDEGTSEVRSGRKIATLPADLRAATVDASGRIVATICWDQALRLFEVESGRCLLVHRNSADYVALTASGRAICAGDGLGCVWAFDTCVGDGQVGRP